MTPRSFVIGAFLSAALACGSLYAGPVTLTGLPQYDSGSGLVDRVDTISIVLDPLSGSIHGLPGATVGWGFTVNWDSNAGDYISFTTSSLSGDISAISTGGYTDLIGTGPSGGGSVNFSMAPGSAWSQAFVDGVIGAGGLTIDNGAVPGAEYLGQLTMSFDLFDGDPSLGTDFTNFLGSYQYLSDVAVSVDTPGGGDAPEPSSWAMMLSGAGALALFNRRRK